MPRLKKHHIGHGLKHFHTDKRKKALLSFAEALAIEHKVQFTLSFGFSPNSGSRAFYSRRDIVLGGFHWMNHLLVGKAVLVHELCHLLNYRSGPRVIGEHHGPGFQRLERELCVKHLSLRPVYTRRNGYAKRFVNHKTNTVVADYLWGRIDLDEADKLENKHARKEKAAATPARVGNESDAARPLK